MPAADAHNKNSFDCGMRRLKIQVPQYQSDSKKRSVARPTITSHARWTVLTSLSVGRSAEGVLSSPCTSVFFPVLGSESHDASPGMRMPPVTVPFEFK